MTESQIVRWRRDASSSRVVRVCWALGAGTFLAAISLVAVARVFAFAGEVTGPSPLPPLTTGQLVVAGVVAGIAATVVALAVSHAGGGRLPYTDPDDDGIGRAVDAGVGAVAMGAIMVGLAVRVGGTAGELLVATTIPVALVLIVASVFLRSTGAIDPDEGVLYLYDPDEAVALEHVEAVSVRTIGDSALVTLSYARPDGEYVPGPRRLVVPPAAARELRALVGTD